MKAMDRLYEYLKYKGTKPTRFEKNIGLSNGYLSSQLKRNADLGESVINKIINYYLDISLEWLLIGSGNMLKSEEEIGSSMVMSRDVFEQISRLTQTVLSQQETIRALSRDKKVAGNIAAGA